MAGRYDNETTASMPHVNGSQVTVVLRKPHFWPNQPYLKYTLTAADHMWTLADRNYNNSLDWWVIADMNPHVPCPDDLRYGLTIFIPVG